MSLNIQERVPLAPYTTFKIGGSARYFVEAHSEDEIIESCAWARERDLPCVLLAGGSNMLVPDQGIDGLVVHMAATAFRVHASGVEADAGADLLTVIRAASAAGLGGWEKLAGIPGTIGGAVRGNAGAFGTEIKDVLAEVHAIHIDTGERKVFANAECAFSYRMSYFKLHPEWVITRILVDLRPVASAESMAMIEETIRERERRHLQNVRAAGSYFMNPVAPPDIVALFESEKGVKSRENRVPAGWLIEKAGMKGARVGDAQASVQHPNYIVNTGTASAADVRALAAQVKRAVREQFGVELQEEAVVL